MTGARGDEAQNKMAARAGVMPTHDPAWPMIPSGGGLPAPPPPSPQAQPDEDEEQDEPMPDEPMQDASGAWTLVVGLRASAITYRIRGSRYCRRSSVQFKQ